jgi:hypothetical protein
VFFHVVLEVARAGEGDEYNLGVRFEFGDPIADRNRMSCAGQSMDMAVEDQYHRLAPLLVEAPGFAVLIDQQKIGGRLANGRTVDRFGHAPDRSGRDADARLMVKAAPLRTGTG